MRFDDSLKTVLAADHGPGFGAQSAWRQIVDLLGRGRVVDEAAEAAALARLAELRPRVAAPVRAASARALAFAKPGAPLVAFFAADELAIAAPVLRTATLDEADWLALLPRLSPAGRSVLRQRRDVPAAVERGLESFGATDFTLPDHGSGVGAAPADTIEEVEAEEVLAPSPEPAPAAEPIRLVPDAPLAPTPFVALGDITRGLPLVAEAIRQAEEEINPAVTVDPAPAALPAETASRFEIADLVARIDAFQRDRDTPGDTAAPAAPATSFRFETDAAGTIRWVEGVGRAALIGVSLAQPGGGGEGAERRQGLVRVDAGAAAAFRRRAGFADLRLEIAGHSDAAGSWRIAAAPLFDRASGRFLGFEGSGRRPLRHESAIPPATRSTAAEGLRQLVHELRTPANAVAGFAELIETELLGPVAEPYRRRAGAIRSQASGLLTAIDDLDTAARIEGQALELRAGNVPLGELAARLATDLAALTRQRGAMLTLSGEEAVAAVDDRAAERLMARLLATLVSAASAGERIAITVHPVGDQAVVAFDRPRRLADLPGDALFSLDGLIEPEEGGPLLGAGFTLRLVRNLAAEMGGSLSIEIDRLVLRLPGPSARNRVDPAGGDIGRVE